MYSKGALQYVIVVFSVGVVIRRSRSYKNFCRSRAHPGGLQLLIGNPSIF